MPGHAADRNLLFGILALQMDFITRDALIASMNAWAMEKHRPPEEILVERGALDPKFRAMLGPMVDAHAERHGGDPAASLVALSHPQVHRQPWILKFGRVLDGGDAKSRQALRQASRPLGVAIGRGDFPLPPSPKRGCEEEGRDLRR